MPLVFRSVRFWILPSVIFALTQAVTPARGQTVDPDVGDPYPLPNCVVLDEPLDRRARVLTEESREIRVCCKECVKEFEKNYDTWIRVVDDRIIQQQSECYPLTTCIVDGKPLGDSGVIDFVFRNRLFRLCDYVCQEKIEKEPAKYFDKLDKAVIEKQKPNYPLTKCIVSGQPLGKNAIDHVVGNRLVRLGNSNLIDKFNQTPGKYLTELAKAAKKKADK